MITTRRKAAVRSESRLAPLMDGVVVRHNLAEEGVLVDLLKPARVMILVLHLPVERER